MPTEKKIMYMMAISLAFLVLMCCVPLASGEESTTMRQDYSSQQTPAPSSNHTTTKNEESQQKLAAIEPILLYKQNETVWQQKLTSDLLQIIDPNYPDTGLNLQSKKNTLRLLKVLIPADKVATELNISKSLSQPVGDHLFVSIIINKSYSINIIDHYITNITGHDEKNTLYGWVDINNIEEIASLEAISSISISYPPITHMVYDSVEGNNSIVSRNNRTQLNLIQTTTNLTFFSVSTTSPFVSSVPTTPASPVSVIGTCTALTFFLGIIILSTRSAKRR